MIQHKAPERCLGIHSGEQADIVFDGQPLGGFAIKRHR
jgi:hypothetical protein